MSAPIRCPRCRQERRAARNLSNLTPRARQAFLLIAVEGFDREEAAEILDVDTDEFGALLNEASEEISGRLPRTS